MTNPISNFRQKLSLRSRIKTTTIFLAGVLPAAILIVINRIFRVRIGKLRCSRIGHYIAEPEITLAEEGRRDRRFPLMFDIWYEVPPISNSALQQMWRRKLRIWPRWLCEPIGIALKIMGAESNLMRSEDKIHDANDALIHTDPILSFTEAETREARRQLRILGVPHDAEWICLHNRDSAYLAKIFPQVDYHYHDYRDSDVNNLVAAAEALADRGYWVLRIGAVVDHKLESPHPRVIDVSGNLRTDLLDVYLIANCKFLLSTGAGISSVGTAFRRPQLLVNKLPINDTATFLPYSLVLFKHMMDNDTGDRLGIPEIISRGLLGASESSHYVSAGVNILENDSIEIRDAALEMDDLLNDPGSLTLSEIEASLLFWDSCREHMIPFRPNQPRLKVAHSYLEGYGYV